MDILLYNEGRNVDNKKRSCIGDCEEHFDICTHDVFNNGYNPIIEFYICSKTKFRCWRRCKNLTYYFLVETNKTVMNNTTPSASNSTLTTKLR